MLPKRVKIDDLNYDRFVHTSYPVGSSSIQHQLDEQRDLRNNDEFPASLTEHNTLIRQQFFDVDDIDFEYLGSQLGMDVITVSAILQEPGHVNPVHRDTFYQIGKRFPVDSRTKARANIFLEDWVPGHLIQYETHDGWVTVDNWKQGEGVMWTSETAHIGANAGLTNKYTLQVSGFLRS